MDLAGGISPAFHKRSLNREPIDARPNFTGPLLSSARLGASRRVASRRGALRCDRFSEHLVLVSTTLPRESIIPGEDKW